MPGIEISEGFDSEEMPVSGIEKCIPGSKIGHFDDNCRAGFTDAMQFLHHLYRIIEMFNYIIRIYFIKGGFLEGIGKNIEIMNDICIGTRIYVDPDHTAPLTVSATKIQHLFHRS